MFLQAIINGAEKPGPTHQSFKCKDSGNFKSNDLLTCRDDAFKSLYKSMGKPGRYTGFDSSFDTNAQMHGVWTYALCPPNIKMEACLECFNNTIPYLIKNCPKQKEGVAWTALPKVTCILRYADYSIHGDFAEWAWTSFSTPPNETSANVAELEKGLTLLANNLKEKAAGGDNNKKFTSGAIPYGPGAGNAWPLYGYMQCTPGISKDKCIKCLNDANRFIHNCCGKGRKLSAIALSTNCYFWCAHMDFSPKKL
ncbi:hypothetical protein L1987_07385 [Smallanthus sonchifolius]|uniref:Uncharacterized protein n=1 Tax=Smallanthus sonchifolius TaxID=185202 RepID=A0ACB9K0E8_9ASTR|nr:hypothetical protein L1987_07385 [Smallanthus sonchifolius]